MNVDNDSAMQELERPITFEMADDLQPAEMVSSKGLRFSITNLLNNSYQENLLSEGDISGLLIKSVSYAMDKRFVSEKDYLNSDKVLSIAQSQACTSNMLFALYNSLVLLYREPSIGFNELASLISNYNSNVELENILESRNVLKPYCFMDDFLVKFHENPFVFPFWSTRYDSIYSIFRSLLRNHPVLVRVNGKIYFNDDNKKAEHYVVLVGLRYGKALTIDSSVDGFIHYCPLGTFLYSMASDFFATVCAWDLSLLL